MFRLRTRVSVTRLSEHILLMRSNAGRRILFGIVGLVLLVAFLMSVDFSVDFQTSGIAGTVFYLIITLTSIGVAAWGASVVFDTQTGTISFVKRIFGLQVGREDLEIGDVKAVTIHAVRFLKESESPQPGLLNTRFRNYVERRNNYFKLYLETTERLRLLDDSNELADLEGAADEIATFLKVPRRTKSL